jgi:tetratricopeptide (TPR) repeat protein
MSNLKLATLLATLIIGGGIVTEATAEFVPVPGGLGYNRPKIIKPERVQQEDILYHQAIAEGEKGNHEAAAQLFIKIIKMNPQAAYAYYDLGLTFKNNLNNRDMAVKCFRAAAKVYQQKGDTSMARESMYQISN